MNSKELLESLESYVPLFQTLVWSGIIFIVVILLKKQMRALLEAVEGRIKQGSPFKVGNVELGQHPMITKTADLGSNVEVFGNPDIFQLLVKAQGDSWSKSTKAMEVPGGCVIQVTTEQMNPDGSWSNAEALTFVPGVVVIEDEQSSGRYLGMADRPSLS